MNKAICFLLGHLNVSITALPIIEGLSIKQFDRDIESICLRCRKTYRSLESNVLAESPFFKKVGGL